MNSYVIDGQPCDSVELKSLVVSRGVKVDPKVYKKVSPHYRLSQSPLHCNCMRLSDGTVVQLTDMAFHLKNLKGMLSWDTLKMMKYMKDLVTDFVVALDDNDEPVLTYKGEVVDHVSFPPKVDFYLQKTKSGLPFSGNAVLQGVDWVAFQCLWPCEYGAAGKPCQFCFSGAQFESLKRKGKPLPAPVSASDFAEIVNYAIDNCDVNSIQITGGSTFRGEKEAELIKGYLQALRDEVGLDKIKGEILLYITPPESLDLIDEYFALGATKIACSIEVWDEGRAQHITPGKIEFTTRQRHLDALEYIANKYGPNKAFSNFIIGLESLETLEEGARWCAERGIIPTASTWMPQGAPVMGSMKAPDLDYYHAMKELFADLYREYGLEPAECCGLNVCVERDIWRYARERTSQGE